MGEQRFICDGMAGRLARWLRLLGYDTRYFNARDKEPLVRAAREEGRCVLTRDRRFAARFPREVHLLRSDDTLVQLREVVAAFRLAPSPELLGTRCSLCNEQLADVEKAAVAGRVPAFTFERRQRFRECPRCRRVYWEGDHVERMRRVFSSL